jgi:hypothetical protein
VLSQDDLAKQSGNTFFGQTWSANSVVHLALEHTSSRLEKLNAFA